jgi:hypothetical protein
MNMSIGTQAFGLTPLKRRSREEAERLCHAAVSLLSVSSALRASVARGSASGCKALLI